MKWHREWFISVPWGKLSLVSRGHPDGEPVLLVHGRQDSLTVFEPMVQQMSEQYYYVALDMPGNGLSDAFPHGPKLMRFHFLYAMELALLHLGWDRFIFIGHSMGCEQGLFYNAIYPGVISKMILLDAGPTLLRMQVEDNREYQNLFYDSYYDNYDQENFQRRTHTRKTAIQSLQRSRDLDERQSIHLLTRNFHEYGTERSNPIEERNTSELQNPVLSHSSPARDGQDPNEPRVMYMDTIPQFDRRNGNGRRDEDAPQNENGPRNKNGPRNENDPRNENGPRNESGPRNLNGLRAAYRQTDPNRPPWSDNALETLRPHSNRLANRPRDANEVPASERDNGSCDFTQHLSENENDRPGYLSWDNRLKHLAPQNYGNDYYFELFKTIPPTLLIAASDGAKNTNPKRWEGAKKLLDKMATLENFHRVDVEGGHDVHFTHPERVLPHINAFLKDNKLFSKL